MRLPIFFPLAALALLSAGCGVPLQGLQAAGHGSYPMDGPNGGYRLTRNLVYTPPDWPEKCHGDLYQPKTAGLSPAVLLIHGGGWTGGDGRWQMESIAKQLVKHGYVVMNVTYRQAPEWVYPAPVDDMREALAWMREHSAEYGIDSKRIATFGYSAGGYLAVLASDDPDADLRAVVAGGVPANLSLYPGGDLIPKFLGGRRDEIPEVFREASPVNHISHGTPPVFVYHATEDRLVPPEHARQLIGELERYEVPHEVYWVQGKGHIHAFLFPAGAVNRAVEFLDGDMR